MAERSVAVRFDANVQGYMAGVAKMQAATAGFAKSTAASATKHKADWDKIGNGALIGGAVIGAAVLGAAKAYMEFEAAMSGVAAVADATAQQQKALGKAAIQAGQDTVFSATEAAKAEAELAKAGVSVSDILGGALKGSLDLAAAGQIDLGKAAEISAQAMNIFKLEGSDVGHIADVLTAGANKSAAGVDDLGMALQQSGLVAAQTGLSLEDTTGVLSAFADNALKGSDAGTSLKTMLQRLNPQSDEAAGLMDELGLRAYDAQGNFVGITKYAGKLQTALGGLSVEQRNAALSTLFGSDAIRGAAILMEQGEAGVRKYIDAVNDQGAAQRMAARQTDNLKGDLEQLKGTLESAFINGGQGSNAGLRSLVQGLTNLVNGFNNLSPAAQTAAVQVAAVTAGALLLGGAGIKAVSGITAMSASLKTLGASSATAAAGMKLLTGAIAVAGVAMLATELGKVGPAAATADVGVRGLVSSVGQLSIGGRLTGGIADLFREDNGIFGSNEKWVSTGEAVQRFATLAYNAFSEDFSAQARRIQDFGASSAKMDETIRKLDGSLAELVRSGNADQAKASLEALLKGISDPAVRSQVAAQFTSLQAALDETAVGAGSAATAIDPLTGKTKDAGNAAQQAADDTKAWADALNGLNSPMLDARSAAVAFEAAIDDASEAVKKNGKTLKIGAAAGRENRTALDGVAKAALDQIGALQANGGSQKQLQATLNTSRARLIATAEKFGMSKAAARAYADQVLKVPKAVRTTITANTTSATASVEGLKRRIAGLNGKTITITTRFNNVGSPGGGRDLQGGLVRAAGGPIYGPGTGTSDSIPALLSNGEHVLTADEVAKAGGHDAIYRMRRGINAGALKFAQGGAVGPAKFAEGGAVDWQAILAILGDVMTGDEVNRYRAAQATAATGVKTAGASVLYQRAAVNLANAALAAARRTPGRGDDNAALDRRRTALARLTAAESKYRDAVAKSGAAARATSAALKEYNDDRRPLIDRTLTASWKSTTATKTFLDNIDKLVKMGFKSLAMNLLNQGGPEAETLAAQAVASAAKAKSLQSTLNTSASLANREAAIRAALEGTSLEGVALNGLGTIRDLGPLARPGGVGVAAVTTVSVRIDGALDPISVGAQVEKVLQTYTSTTGRPLQVVTQ